MNTKNSGDFPSLNIYQFCIAYLSNKLQKYVLDGQLRHNNCYKYLTGYVEIDPHIL